MPSTSTTAYLQKAVSSTLNWEAMNPTDEFANHTLHSYISFYMRHTKDIFLMLPFSLVSGLQILSQNWQDHCRSVNQHKTTDFITLRWLENSAWDRTTFPYMLHTGSDWIASGIKSMSPFPKNYSTLNAEPLLTSKWL